MSRSAPSSTESPLFTQMDFTTPPLSAWMLFSIFIASRITTVSPAATVSPTLTLRSRITPGSGAFTAPAPPAAAGLATTFVPASVRGAAAGLTLFTTGAGAAACSSSTLYVVPLTETSAMLFSMSPTATLYSCPLILYLYSFIINSMI